jgi:hypothetical protein
VREYSAWALLQKPEAIEGVVVAWRSADSGHVPVPNRWKAELGNKVRFLLCEGA